MNHVLQFEIKINETDAVKQYNELKSIIKDLFRNGDEDNLNSISVV